MEINKYLKDVDEEQSIRMIIDFIKSERQKQGLSLRDLSLKIRNDFTKNSHLSKIERYDRLGLEFKELLRILRALGYEFQIVKLPEKKSEEKVYRRRPD